MKKRTITALLGTVVLVSLFSCTQAEPETIPSNNSQSQVDPNQPIDPTPPVDPVPPIDPVPPVDPTPSSSSDLNPATDEIPCGSFCKWEGGCMMISTDPLGLYGTAISTCTAAIENCQKYSPSKQVYATEACSGGTTTPSSSSKANASSASTGGSVECSGYCKWDTGCVRIATDPKGEYGSVVSTCAAAIENCTKYSPSKQTYSTETCSGGTVTPSSSSGGSNVVKTSFTDSRDSKSYKSVKIGTQTWMAENLNYNASGSKCKPSDCSAGRQYDWSTAQTVCPSGWHLPSNEEWIALAKFIAPSCDITGACEISKKLTVPSDYGTDDYGFSAVLNEIYTYSWYSELWSSTDSSAEEAFAFEIGMTNTGSYGFSGLQRHGKSEYNNVRCVKN